MKKTIFYLGIATLFTHELDAMQNHEWRLLLDDFLLSDLYWKNIFLFVHIPLFASLIAVVASTKEKIRNRSRIGISIFLIFHGLLHILFSSHLSYEFISIPSNILIFGGALFGILYLLLEFMSKRKVMT